MIRKAAWMIYPENSLYVAGIAKASAQNPIAVRYEQLLTALVFDRENGRIIDADVNMVCELTTDFVKSLLIGYSIFTDLPKMAENISKNYCGLSRKALVVCIKNAFANISELVPEAANRPAPVQKPRLSFQQEGSSLHTFPQSTVCVVGLSKTNSKNPITMHHEILFGSFVVETESGKIVDVQFNTICRITSLFLSQMLVGLSFYTDLDEMSRRVQKRYLDGSCRAVQVILKDAGNKLENWRAGAAKERGP